MTKENTTLTAEQLEQFIITTDDGRGFFKKATDRREAHSLAVTLVQRNGTWESTRKQISEWLEASEFGDDPVVEAFVTAYRIAYDNYVVLERRQR